MDYFDTDKDGTINFEEFLVGIRVLFDRYFRANPMIEDKR